LNVTDPRFRKRLARAIIIALIATLGAAIWPLSVSAVPQTLTFRPNAAGSVTAIASQYPASGEHWDKVDEEVGDDEGTYVYTTSTTYEQDLYAIADPGTIDGTITSVTVYIRYGKSNTDNGTIYCRSAIKTNGSVYTGTEQSTKNKVKWYTTSDQWTLNPYTGSNWTWAEIDALEIGGELMIESGTTAEASYTQLYVEVTYEPTDIGGSPASKAFGNVASGSSYWSNGSAPAFPLDDGECFFTVTNNGALPVDIFIKATNFTGGVGWTLAATPGVNIVTLKAGKSGDAAEGNMVVLTPTDQAFITGLTGGNSKKWEVKMETPTSFSDAIEKTSTITLTATAP